MNLRADVLLRVLFDYTNPLDLTTGRDQNAFTALRRMTEGTGFGQGQRIFSDQVTLAPAATSSFVFNGAGPEDVFGNIITFTRINLIFVRNRTTTAGNYVYLSACPGTPALIYFTGTIPRAYANGFIFNFTPGGLLTVANRTLTVVGGVGTSTVDVIAIGS